MHGTIWVSTTGYAHNTHTHTVHRNVAGREHILNQQYDLSCSLTGSPAVVIDGYTHNSTLTSGDSVPLGTQLILVCQVVGLPYETPLSYIWNCPNGQCVIKGVYGRKVYNQHILVVNTTSTSFGGTHTCLVTATGGQEVSGSFTVRVTGMCCTTAVCVMNVVNR